MAILSLSAYKTWLNYPSSDRDGVYAALIEEACDAVVRYCKNGSLESASYTVYLDAPTRNVLYLPHFPVTAASLQIWLNDDANGVAANFTSDHLLTAGEDYVLDTGPDNVTVSDSGKVTFLAAGQWGVGGYVRPVYSLATRLEPSRKAIKATYTAGWATVPASLRNVVSLVVSKMYAMRKLGTAVTSESLNSYSYSAQGSATAEGIIQGDPTIRQALKPFRHAVQVGGYAGAG